MAQTGGKWRDAGSSIPGVKAASHSKAQTAGMATASLRFLFTRVSLASRQ